MARLTPKQIYEKIVISGETPTEQELKELEGTHWAHKLNGTSPDVHTIYKTKPFKRYVEEEESISAERHSPKKVAEKLLDRLEDRFDLHFAVLGANRVDQTKMTDIKKFLITYLDKVVMHQDDRRKINRLVNTSDNVNTLMTKLALLSGVEF